MQHLGQTRSSYQSDHLLLTPDTFVRTELPGMLKAAAVVHISPARGARFTEYTAEFEPGGSLKRAPVQRFVYVLEGAVEARGKRLSAGDFAYLPQGVNGLTSPDGGRAEVFEKPYRELEDVPPPLAFTGSEANVDSTALGGDPDLQVRLLIPNEPAYDFAVNTMTYQPGAALSMVECHVMEHGMLMLEGGGIYRLGDRWYPVVAGDFVWMAPWCPQWFGALGKTPAKYLIYKDWNR